MSEYEIEENDDENSYQEDDTLEPIVKEDGELKDDSNPFDDND